jgi:hypothetical protein
VAHLLGLFHAGTGVLLKLVVHPSSPMISLRCRRSSRADNLVLGSWRIGACVPTPISPCASRLACMLYGASAHARL